MDKNLTIGDHSLHCISPLTSLSNMKYIQQTLSTNLLPTYFGVHDIADIEKPFDESTVYNNIETTNFDVHCEDDAIKAVLENIGCSFRTVHTVIHACRSSSQYDMTSRDTWRLSEPCVTPCKRHVSHTGETTYETVLKPDDLFSCMNTTLSDIAVNPPTLCPNTPTSLHSLAQISNINVEIKEPIRRRITFQFLNCCFCSLEEQ